MGADHFGNEDYNQIYIYDWALSRWTKADIKASMLMSAATLGYTLEGLDAVSSSIDALPYSLDARSWQGGSPVLAVFTPEGALGFINGQTQETVLTTQEIGDTSGGVTRIHEVYLIAEPTRFRGLMAHDVADKYPDAVVLEDDGYLAVNYGALGINMEVVADV
jgi:hypothetical protein